LQTAGTVENFYFLVALLLLRVREILDDQSVQLACVVGLPRMMALFGTNLRT
jgi:hypothetical protein